MTSSHSLLCACALVTFTSAASMRVDQQIVEKNSEVQSQASGFDCYTRLPVGREKEEAEVMTIPPIRMQIGDLKFGQIKYSHGSPLHVQIKYSPDVITSVFIKAETLFHDRPVGTWTVKDQDTGIKPVTCSNPRDALVLSRLDRSGTGRIDAFWTPSPDLVGYVEFQMTAVGWPSDDQSKEKFWMTNSFLVTDS